MYQKVFGIDTKKITKTNFQYSYINQDREVNFNIENSDTDEIFYANKMFQGQNQLLSSNFVFIKKYIFIL